MFCFKCGNQLPDDACFCSKCGADLRQVAANAEASPAVSEKAENVEFTVNSEPANPQEKVKKPKKKKRVGLVLAIVIPIILVLALAACAVYMLVFNRTTMPTSAIYAYVDDSGNAYLCYDDGNIIKIGGDIEEACMTEDGKKIVVVEKKGLVYWTDDKLSEKHTVSETSDEIEAEISVITNKFFVIAITDKSGAEEKYTILRGEYDDDDAVTVIKGTGVELFDMPFEASYEYAVDDVSFIMAKDGKVSVLSPDSDNFEEIATYDKTKDIELIGISPDGETAAWTVAGDGKYSVMAYYDDRTETVASESVSFSGITKENYLEYMQTYVEETYVAGKYVSVEDYYLALMDEWTAEILEEKVEDGEAFIIKKLTEYFSAKATAPSFSMSVAPDDSVAVITGDKMTAFIKDGKVSVVSLPSKAFSDVYSTNGYYLDKDMNADAADGYFVLVEEENSDDGDVLASLYYISFKKAEREKILSSIKDVTFAQDKVIYTNKSDVLECAVFDAKKIKLGDPQRIGTDIEYVEVSSYNSDYIYYSKNYSEDDDTFDLYVYDFKNDSGEKISSDVSGDFTVSYDGKQVYYFTDRNEDSKMGVRYSTLKAYDVKLESSSTVSADVVEYSLTSNILTGEIDPDSLWFEKYQSSKEESYVFNLCHYDGKEIFVAVKNLVSK